MEMEPKAVYPCMVLGLCSVYTIKVGDVYLKG